MAAKPRKKEPTLAEMLAAYGVAIPGDIAQYGRNIASDVPVVGRRIVEGVRSLPEMADTGSRFALGAAQRLGDMLPPELRGPALRGDYRPSIDEVTGLARDVGSVGNRLVTGTSQRGLDALGAPRGAGYDLPATEMSRMAQDAVVSGAQALPQYMYEHPLGSAYTAALMLAPTPGRVVRGATALGKAVRGRRAAPSLAAKYNVAAPLSVEESVAAAPPRQLGVKDAPPPKPQEPLRKTIDLDYYGNPVQVMQNPTPARLQGFLNKSKYKAARRITDPASGDVYVWDADAPALHALVAERLGLKYDPKMGDMIGLD